jgi:hypothetical protein
LGRLHSSYEYKPHTVRILGSNIIGKSPVGKPRETCVNAVEIDSREFLKVKNWKGKSLDRQVWRRHFRDAKAKAFKC